MQSDSAEPSLGDERECPSCGGRQILMSVGFDGEQYFLKTGEAWVCTDSQCDRRDRHMGSDRSAEANQNV